MREEQADIQKSQYDRNKKKKRAKILEDIFDVGSIAFPVAGICTVFTIPSNTIRLVAGALGVVSASYSNGLTKELEKRHFARRKNWWVRKKLAPILIGCNIFSIAFSGMNITKSDSTALVQTGAYTGCKVICEYHPIDKEELLSRIDETIEENISLSDEDRMNIRRTYRYLSDNPYLQYLDMIHHFEKLDILQVQKLGVGRTVAVCDKGNDIIYIYNNSEALAYTAHEVIHLTGSFPYRFLDEGMTTILESEYCFSGYITNAYSSEVKLTEIVIELVGEDALLKSFSEENMDTLYSQTDYSSEFLDLLNSFEEFCIAKQEFLDMSKTDIEYQTACLRLGLKLQKYMNQNFPCNHPAEVHTNLDKKATIYKLYNEACAFDFISSFDMSSVSKVHYNKRIKLNSVDEEMSIADAISIIDTFDETMEPFNQEKLISIEESQRRR